MMLSAWCYDQCACLTSCAVTLKTNDKLNKVVPAVARVVTNEVFKKATGSC